MNAYEIMKLERHIDWLKSCVRRTEDLPGDPSKTYFLAKLDRFQKILTEIVLNPTDYVFETDNQTAN